jgi:hypothetical protein
MNPNEYLLKFFAELERLVDGHGTRQVISATRTGQLEVRLGVGDWHWATQIAFDDDPVRTAQSVAHAEKYFSTSIKSSLQHGVPWSGRAQNFPSQFPSQQNSHTVLARVLDSLRFPSSRLKY